ncbi:hypothetical protein FF38_11508 [Lucilia cuprina]|uniref:Uncharacterized protein n=1 Tax=Lucilia cuprina TaxID=7375 RepID=A0A0L0CDG1_LUCCU|nr:hypothetical protein FF38_11508 [Lucilia cuprina]
MLILKQTLYCFLLLAVVGMDPCTAVRITQRTISKGFLVQSIMKLLNKLEKSNDLNVNIQFTAILSEFLIKQKQRYYESNRYEQQVYYKFLQKLNHIIRQTEDADFENVHKTILDNIFQRNIMLIPPVLKQRHIDTHFEYKSLIKDYGKLVGLGNPNITQSDECLATIAALNSSCQVPRACIDLMISDLPTYGYQRMHQILLLYVFMHHICAPTLGSQTAYEILASQKCTQVYREQNVLRHLNIPDVYRDLYLEQNVICGLFGYVEFMNWHNLVTVSNWPQENECLCLFFNGESKIDCNCQNHINSLVLVYYINGFLMLD